MASPYCTGPVHIYVGIPPSANLQRGITTGNNAQGQGSAGGPPQSSENVPLDPGAGGKKFDGPDQPQLLYGIQGGAGGSAQARPAPIKPNLGDRIVPLVPVDEGAATSPAYIGPSRVRAYYLGTARHSPVLEMIPHYRKITDDFSGGPNGVGIDVAYVGEEAYLRADLTRWNENVYSAIASKPGAGAGRGRTPANAIGSLMSRGGYAHRLYFFFPYGASKSFGKQGVTGYRFLRAMLVAPESLHSLGSKPKAISLIWNARYEVTYATKSDTKGPSGTAGQNDDVRQRRAPADPGMLTLYDHDLSEISGINPD